MTATHKVDNDIYRRLGHAWWDDEVGEFSSLRFWMNPVRFAYFANGLAGERSPRHLLHGIRHQTIGT